MASPRTIRTLAALVVAMTAGTFSLMLLETDPVGSSVNDFATIVAPAQDHFQALSQTRVPVQPEKWRSIVLESSDASTTPPRNAHLVVRIETDPQGEPVAHVDATDLWTRQEGLAGQGRPAGSIVVCMVGDFTRANPSVDVFQTVVGLTQRLQRIAEITADHVYLPGDYDARRPQFTPAFSAAFHNNLLR